MIDPTFSEAWVHAPSGHSVLGRLLHPLSALDLLALEAISSPFLMDGEEGGLHDLCMLVWILSNPHAKDCTISNIEPRAPACVAWLDSVAKGSWSMEEECRRVQVYMSDYYALPEMMRDQSKDPQTPLGCPWMLSTVVSVCRTLHVPLYDAWTMGIGQLMWYRCSIEEMDSDSRVVGPELRKDMDRATHAVTVYERLTGESDSAFADRLGISAIEVQILTAR